MSRLLILQFNNRFTEGKADGFIERDLTSSSAKEYLLRLAIDGYNRLITNKQFTVSETSNKAFINYRLINDGVYKWLEDNKGILLKPSNLNNKTVDEIYGEYTTYMDIAQPNIIKTGIEKFIFCDLKNINAHVLVCDFWQLIPTPV